MATPTSVSAQLMANPEFAPQVQGLERQRRMAEMLMTQGLQPQQGQMISGRYVAPAWTQQLAGLANIAAGNYLQEKADTKQQELANALRGKQQEVVQNYMNYTQGKPEERIYASDVGPAREIIQGKPDYARAFQAATSEYAPQWLTSMAVEQLKPQKLGEGEQLFQRDFATGELKPLAGGGIKLAGKVNEAAQLLGIRKPYDQWSPQELNAVNQKVEDLTRKGASVSNTVVNMGQHGFDNALKLRENFKAEPVYKGFTEVQAAHNQVTQAAKMATPAGDLAAATKVMKILDPSSVVRESELGMAMQATGLEDKVRNYANQIQTGQKLTPAQRADFVNLSNKLFVAAGQQYNQKRMEYENIAKQNDLNVSASVPPAADLTIPQAGQFSIREKK